MRIKLEFVKCGMLLLAGCFGVVRSGVAGDEAGLHHLTISRISGPPRLEEFLTMKPKDDHGMVRVEGFVQSQPDDAKPVTQRTVAYLGYGASNLYVVFVCYDAEPDKIRAHMVKREDIFQDDRVVVMLDTFHDGRRAYYFLANPYGIQADAQVVGHSYDFSFDTVWSSEGKRTPQGYIVLMAFPFKSLRFSDAPQQTWGISLGRIIPRRDEASWWPYVTSRVEARIPQAATLDGLQNISPGRNLQFIPYSFFRSFRSLDTVDTPPRFVQDHANLAVGLDVKVCLER